MPIRLSSLEIRLSLMLAVFSCPKAPPAAARTIPKKILFFIFFIEETPYTGGGV
jgi:hypothetical protein